VDLAGLTDWFRILSRGYTGPLFFERRVIGPAYFKILQTSIVPAIRELNGNEELYFQQNMVLHITTEISGATSMKDVQADEKGSPDLTFLTFTCEMSEECSASYKASDTGRVTGRN
jgi:hypothetical protein